MPHTRRSFLQQAAAFSLALASARKLTAQQTSHDAMPGMSMPTMPSGSGQATPDVPMLHSLQLTPFVDPLPLPARALATHGSPNKLRIAMREVHARVHRDLPPARQWAYVDANAPHASSSLAPLIEARTGEPLQIEWLNQLPTKHFLPVDFSLHGCGHDIPEVRAVAHLHGARAPTVDDGYPTDWFVPGQSRTCHYPFQQDAATLWYHDHAMGLNRLSMYAGLFGMAIVRDPAELALGLPSGPHELPLILYDRDFTTAGQLFYPTSGDPSHPWVPEFDGDAILINGKIRPFHAVEPRPYRLRLLNTANSRFFRLSVVHPDATAPTPTTRPPFRLPADRLRPGPSRISRRTQIPDPRTGRTCRSPRRLQRPRRPDRSSPQRCLRHPAIPRSRHGSHTAKVSTNNPPHHLHARRLHRHCHPNHHPQRVSGQSWQLHAHAAQPQALARAHHRAPQTQLHRDLGVRQSHRRRPSMHLHLVRFQILDRRPFDTFAYIMQKQLSFTGPAIPPDANEAGWKDVVQCSAASITRILVKFEGYTGKYLYHCHILEHEANDMMRPFEVIA